MSRSRRVVLPDGELEDTGTTFTVRAEAGRTTSVAVEEGSVVLHLRGQPPISVGAGDTWTPAAPAVAASANGPTPSAPATRMPVRLAPPPSTKPASAPAPSGSASDESADFRGPMSAFDRGDNREAAEGFARFLRIHPHGARAEDAAYLRVIALQRCGDHEGTRSAAAEYLLRFPAGFRRTEVDALSR